MTNTYGDIKSPGYPGNYPPSRDCYWTVNVNPGLLITFAFGTLSLEHHDNCNFDYLEVRKACCILDLHKICNCFQCIFVKIIQFPALFYRSEMDYFQRTQFWENTAVQRHHHLYRRRDHLPGSTFTLISASVIGDFILHTLPHHVSKVHSIKTH